MDDVRIYTGSDHAGFSLRNTLVARLRAQGREVVDLGTNSDAACDYPEFASAVGNAVRRDPRALGILVCATGQGMAIAAGKVRGIRAVVPATIEAARLSRFDNNANVLCIGGRLLAELDAFAIVDTWLTHQFCRRSPRPPNRQGRGHRNCLRSCFYHRERALQPRRHGHTRPHFRPGSPSHFSPRACAQSRPQRAFSWVSLPADMTAKLPEITSFIEEVRKARFTDLIVLVEGA
jgi:ribose 5-phosphate isomerase B